MAVSDYTFTGYETTQGVQALPGKQMMWRMGRYSPIDREFMPYVGGFFPPDPSSEQRLRPVVLPSLPESADQWGVAYPAGSVAVVDSLGTGTRDFDFFSATYIDNPYPGDLEARWQKWWRDDARFCVVPGVLPGDYTPRTAIDWSSLSAGSQAAADVRTFRMGNGFDYCYLTPDGYSSPISWLPQNDQNGTLSNGPTAPSGGYHVYNGYGTSGGYRKIQYRIAYVNALFTSAAWTGTIDVTLSHNADGSYPGSTDGDTIDHTHSFSFGDFTFTGTGGFNSAYTTAWIDAGSVLASSLGTITAFQAAQDLTTVLGLGSYGVVMEMRLSPRCDIPFPFTILGKGDLIAPGGVL